MKSQIPPRPRHLTGAVLGALIALVAALAVTLGTSSAASASVVVPPGCGQPSLASSGQKISLRCTSGHGGRYQITASACDSHHCVSLGSNVVRYGTTASISSGGYFTTSSVRVYWYPASGGSACLYTKPGGTVAWCDMQASILDWAGKRPYYDGAYPTNWYRDKYYRTDCSGLVSMAWHLTSIPDTDALATSTYTKAIARKDLRAGDILDDVKGAHGNHHVVIFAGWNAGHHAGTTDGTFRIWTFGYGTFADDSGHHELNDSFKAGSYVGKKPQADYVARRYLHGAP